MKNFLKKAITLSLGVMMAFSVAACGTGSDDGSKGGKVKIIVPDLITSKKGLNTWTLERQEAFKEAYPNIEVE